MQTDAEADPRLDRDINADIALAGAVEGIDVLFGGHADAGTREPVVQPDTGTLIMQTFGQATYLGYLQVTVDGSSGEIKNYDGKLIPVNADELAPDPAIARKNADYQGAYPEIMEVVGRNEVRLNRKYFDEADIGNFTADVMVEATGADIGFMHSGGIRKDLPAGDVRIMDILDTHPFVDNITIMRMNGAQLRLALEHSFSQLRGLLQMSGVSARYDTSRPIGQRIVSVTRNGAEIRDSDVFEVAVSGIIARGGDHYDVFLDTEFVREFEPMSDLMIAYYRKHGTIPLPQRGRQIDIAESR